MYIYIYLNMSIDSVQLCTYEIAKEITIVCGKVSEIVLHYIDHSTEKMAVIKLNPASGNVD